MLETHTELQLGKLEDADGAKPYHMAGALTASVAICRQTSENHLHFISFTLMFFTHVGKAVLRQQLVHLQ